MRPKLAKTYEDLITGYYGGVAGDLPKEPNTAE